MHEPSEAAGYVLGHTDAELARLARQAAFFSEATREVLRRAGLQPGMRVLDLGCGVGDVSLIAGELVGAGGTVLGIDRSAEAIGTARARVAAAGVGHITFAQRDIAELAEAPAFDAVIGRFILLHMPQPDAILRRVCRLLGPQGILAFAEMDIRSASVTPPLPVLDRCLGWIVSVYERAGLEPDMGSHLFRIFRKAGLDPSLLASCRISGGGDVEGLDYLADSVRSLMPALASLGIAQPDEIGIDDLGDRLAAAAEAGDHCIVFPRLVGAWARTGGA